MAGAGRGHWLWLTLAVVAADRATKFAIERHTPIGFRRELVPQFAALVHSQNQGMAFGMLSDSASHGVSIMLGIVSAAVVLLLVGLLLAGRVSDGLNPAGLALVAGGAAGNLVDRFLHGGVTDFVELHAGSFFWPAFNLADAAITIGVALLAWRLLQDSQSVSNQSA